MRVKTSLVRIGGRRPAGVVVAGFLAMSSLLPAIEPLPPAAVNEWIGAFRGNHDSLRAITTDEMMLALAISDRLDEVRAIVSEAGADEEAATKHSRSLGLVSSALNQLVRNGHLKEAAKVDAVTLAASPRLRNTRGVCDSAARLAAAGEGDALLRMAETLMLVPGCDRNKEFEVMREQAYTARSIEVPPVDNATLMRSTVLLPLLVRAGVIDRFRALAEQRVAAVPEDFKSVRVLTLATLLDTGDHPDLWKRIADATGFFRGRDFVALKDAVQLCYQLRIPAPHLCAMAGELYDEADKYGTSFQRHEFSLMMAALWKDLGRLGEARRMHGAALDSLSKPGLSRDGRILEHYAGVLVDALADERLMPELDRWIEHFSVALDERGDTQMFYRHVLSACGWALAADLPEPVLERWLRLADKAAETRFTRMDGTPRFSGQSIRRHIFLLQNAGMIAQAAEMHQRLTRAMNLAKHTDLDPAAMKPWMDAPGRDREPLVLRTAEGHMRGSLRWQEGREYLGHSSRHPVFLADVFRTPAEGGDLDPALVDQVGHPRLLLSELDLIWQDGWFQFRVPAKPAPPWLADQIAPRAEEKRDPEPRRLPGSPNLIPDKWLLYGESGPSAAMVSWENRDGMIRLGRRGALSRGERLALWSAPFPLEDEADYLFSGRIRAFGRAGVTVQFLGRDQRVIKTQMISEHLDHASPGERWFRVILKRSKEQHIGHTVPLQAMGARIVLTNSLTIEGRWSDLVFCRLDSGEE